MEAVVGIFYLFATVSLASHVEQIWVNVVLFLGSIIGCFWGSPIVTSALIGLLLRPFPALAIRHGKFENWMQFDLDWDEQGT